MAVRIELFHNVLAIMSGHIEFAFAFDRISERTTTNAITVARCQEISLCGFEIIINFFHATIIAYATEAKVDNSVLMVDL